MPSTHQGAVLHQLGRLFGRGTVSGLSEWQLLSRYLSDRDEAAFEALVAQHGPMVLGVCQRLLTDANDVDDAFQATFLVLVRRASSLGERDAIGPWLYGVAYRVALRARSESARRHRREPTVAAAPIAPAVDAEDFELGSVLDEELSRLPPKYRAPLVLCYLEGLSHEQAAGQLQWPLGTVKGRLVRARELLKGRLVRRGLSVSAAVSVALLDHKAVAYVPETLRTSTVATAMNVAAGPITAGIVSASVAALMEGGLLTMSGTKLKTAAATVLIVGLLGAGVVVVAQSSSREKTDPRSANEPGPPNDRKPDENPTVPDARPSGSKERAQRRPSGSTSAGSGRISLPLTDDPGSVAILDKLETPISMSFGNETPLEDILKYIRSATAGPNDQGIPIYVDPLGLQAVEKTMTSPVSFELEGVPLKTTLKLILKQLGLSYRVQEGVLIISAGVKYEETTLTLLEEKLERGDATAEDVTRLVEMLQTINEIKKLKAEGRALEPPATKPQDGKATESH